MLVVNNDMYVVSRHGAEQVEAGSSGTSGQPRPQRTFVGAGYRLGETDGDTTVVPGAAVAASQRQVNPLTQLSKPVFARCTRLSRYLLKRSINGY